MAVPRRCIDWRVKLERLVDDALRQLGVVEEDPLGVACSGGGDSTALLHLLAHRKPLVIHTRSASDDTIAILKEQGGEPADFMDVRPEATLFTLTSA